MPGWAPSPPADPTLDDAPAGYAKFDSGVATKYVIDPHGMTGKVQPV